MNHQLYSELCPIYALGALDGADLIELKAHLESGCVECERRIHEYSNLAARLPEALGDVALSPTLKQSLMEKIYADLEASSESPSTSSRLDRPPKVTRTPITWLPWGLAAAAVLLLVAVLWEVVNLDRQLAVQQVQLQQELEQVEHLKEELQREQLVITFLQTPDIRITSLTGTPTSPQASGTVFWSTHSTQAYFFASNLPVAPAGKTYQLWMITDKPVSAGIFGVNIEGKGSLPIEGLSDTVKAQKFAVTLEPAGGVPQPTGDMHLLGSI